MKKLFVFVAALFGVTLAIAQASSGSNSDCGWYTGVGANKTGPYRSAEGACMAAISAMPEVDKPNNGGKTRWTFTSASKSGSSDASALIYNCFATLPGIFNTPQPVTTVNSKCTTQPDDFCKAKKGVVIKRVFDWLDNPGDDYDLYKLPDNISFDQCEYKRSRTVKIADKPRLCKYSATVDYVGTGLSRDNPTMSDVAESCGPDDDDGEEGEVTPGSFPAIRDLYEAKYPKGVAGVVTAFKADIEQTQFKQLITKMTAQTGLPGVCPMWNFSFDFGFVNLGDRVLAPDCELLKSLKWITIISALFLARRIIFGG